MVVKPEPKAGDPCPQCGGEFRAANQPTDEQRAAAANREQPTTLPPNSDTATKQAIAELGALHTCRDCGYETRIKPELADVGAGKGKGKKAATADTGE